jgi:6-phosphogluconate dehydrogenase
MQIGMIGLGRMGSSLARRLARAGHECVVYDVSAAAVRALRGPRIRGAASLDALVAQLKVPRAVWIMVPAAVTGATVASLSRKLAAGDTIIDGGNSHYHDDIERARTLRARRIHYIDCGTSGGVFGLDRGFCLMVGGERPVVKRLEPVFRSIAPGAGAAPRTRGRSGPRDPSEQGYLYCGPAGAGHFVKMVHNGIEYGLMAAYAEGLNILRHANAGKRARPADAETAPLRHPELYRYDFDLPRIAELWRRGSVIGSWILDLTAASLCASPRLSEFAGHVADSGEGRWTIAAAIDESVPAPVLTAALDQRFSSRGGARFANRVLSAMRQQFGGHHELRRVPKSRRARRIKEV